MISARLVTAISTASWFQAPWSPYALLDADMCIRGVNRAFEHATSQHRDRLLEQRAYEVFPNNPDEPGAVGLAQVTDSLERVLRRGTPHWMNLQRYDVPDPSRVGAFVFKVWMPVHLPITENGRVTAVLHHVQDVTPAQCTEVPGDPAAYDRRRMAAAFEALQRQFPGVRPERVLGLLTDSHRIVLDTIHRPDPDKAADLARIRLEVQTGRPALGSPGPE